MSNIISVRKILQALYYIQSNAPADNEAKNNIMYLLKILFFADRYHLRNYGCLATDDIYYAMKNGPVASATFDILRNNLPKNANIYEHMLLEDVEVIDEYSVHINLQGDDELSDSFKEALDFALENYGNYDHFNLSDISHDYPEWKKYENRLKNGEKRCEIKRDDFFDNPKQLDKSKKLGIKKDPYLVNIELTEALKQDLD
ncbi:MAG: Panacea domain-containing protein [Alphaproteobacteria bacterium]